MGDRSAALAGRFEQAVSDFTKVIDGCSDAQWQAVCGDEGWSVAVTAQHVAGQFPLEMEFITAAAEGKPLPGYSWDDVNGKNDTRAAANTGASKAGVLATLRDGSAMVSKYIRGLSDEQLDRAGELPLAGGAKVTTQQLIEGGVLIEHVTGHMASIKAAG